MRSIRQAAAAAHFFQAPAPGFRAVLNRFLRSLSPESRDVFIRRYWFTQSVAEIAEAFGMSESKVKSLLFRTRNRLRKTLTEEGY